VAFRGDKLILSFSLIIDIKFNKINKFCHLSLNLS